MTEPRRVDAVVVGSGVAGMTAALALAPLSVAIVTKTPALTGGASPMAMGGIAAAVGPGDGPARHGADTIAAAAGHADPDAVRALVREGPDAIARMIELGTRFDRDGAGRLALSREGAHTRARVVRAGGDASGVEVVRALAAAVMESPRIAIRTGTFAEDLGLDGRSAAVLITTARDGTVAEHPADAFVLATGGIGRLFPATTNPREATGDGLAIAARAGAQLADLEFVQFHPTALDVARDPMPLVTEALRGAGATLVDRRGRPVGIEGYEDAGLAPRDVIAYEIFARLARGEPVALDARALGAARLSAEFPSVVRACRAAGYDPCRDMLPVAPAAHFHLGGVAVDLRGRTSIGGVWACGEVACTGAHGANRLASNSLLEALVFGSRVAADVRACLGRPLARPGGSGAEPSSAAAGLPGWSPPPRLESRLRAAIGRGLGVIRDAAGLRETLLALDTMAEEADFGEARNMVLVGRLVVLSALRREESRGAHRRRDFPERDPRLGVRTARTAEAILGAGAAAAAPR